MIHALIPDIHGRPTGGNLFNRHVLSYLEGLSKVQRHVIPAGDPLPTHSGGLSLVDSLLLSATGSLVPGAARYVLLAHYLKLFESRFNGSEAAALEWRYLAPLDGVVATSQHCRNLLVDGGLMASRVAAITPGLDSHYFLELPTHKPSALAQAPRLLTVATILEGKGLNSLLSVLESLNDLDWTWEIAGDPGLDPAFSDRFKRRLANSPIAGRARLLGAVVPAKMIEVYDRASVFVLPSRFESCSIATMEAMIRGLPVIAYRVGGIPERVPSPNAVLLAPSGDSAHLAASLRRLLLDPAEILAIGKANRQAGLSFPTWQQCGAAVWDFLARIQTR